jgi:lipopolysaccharide/colanic/teichoic acid biosynthesis glycosyltransferase/glycosyltransferase involved in cell wall biosynthesis
MKQKDDSTLSLFGDELPVSDLQDADASRKKSLDIQTEQVIYVEPPLDIQIEPNVEAVVVPSPIDATPTKPRTNSPWAAVIASHQKVKPHVMLVITKGEAGGAQSHVLALCEALLAHVRFTVVIGGPDAPSWLGDQLKGLGVEVLALPALQETLLPWRIWPALQGLLALIDTHAPDVLHAHSAMAGLVTRMTRVQLDAPVLYTVHGFGFKPQVPWVRRQMAILAERALSRWTTQMACVSQHERELAYQLPIAHERVHVIPNGIAPSKTPSTPTWHDTPHLIMVARMKSPKRHDLLLHALAQVRDKLGYELPLTLVGNGPLRSQYEALTNELDLKLVTWTGEVTYVAPLLAQHDVLVLLSDHEGMPITVLEAMRGGLTVLASDLPGIREQVIAGQEALLVQNSVDAITEQLIRLVQEPYLRKRLGKAAQLAFESAFTVERMAQRVLSLYQQCIEESAADKLARNANPLFDGDFGASTDSDSQNKLTTDTGTATQIGSTLVSATVRRRDALQSWALWGAWLAIPCWIATQLLQDAGLVSYQFGLTLLWCVLPYAVAAHLLMRASHLPVAERSGVLWVSVAAPFLLTPLGFALLQQAYSRAAVLWAFALTAAWLAWGYRRYVKHRALRLVYWDPKVPSQLTSYLAPEGIDPLGLQLLPWQPFSSQKTHTKNQLPACDGIVLDRHVLVDDARTRLLGQLKMQHLRLYSVEAVAELVSGRKTLPHAGDNLWEIDNDPGYDRIKRLLDVCVLLTLTPVWLPLAAGIAAAVRFDSKGPALFTQERVGRNGRVFKLFKFRSMVHGLQAPGVHFAQAEDPRITRVGRILRRTRLDELPQLWNVLRGEMSLIGPRPEQVQFVWDFAGTIPSYPYRHLVRPGLTGWAQVQQGYADSVDSTRIKLSYDLYYVAHYSLALDLLIAAKTCKIIWTGFGAR